MYQHNVTLNLVVAASNATLLLTRRLSIPFAPFPGLGLTNLAKCPAWSEHPGLTVTSASWDDQTQRWTVELADIHEPAPMSELLDDLGPGWALRESERLAPAPF